MRCRLWSMLLLFGMLGLGVGAARAQVGVYGGFSTASLTEANTPRTYGGMFGLYYDAKHMSALSLGLDLRYVAMPTNGADVKSLLFGPRAVVHVPALPLRVYGQAMLGDGHVTSGQGVAYYSGSGLETAWAVGGDFTILPHVDWRVLEFQDGHIFGVDTGIKTVSTGVVARLP